MKATGLEWPCSSVVEPMDGGSTITSYINPPVTRKYETKTKNRTVFAEGCTSHDGLLNFKSGTASNEKIVGYKHSLKQINYITEILNENNKTN